VDYIVALDPHDFERLRNPILRRYMGSRISLGRVAAIAGIPVADLLDGLTRVGDFTPVHSNAQVDLEQSPTTEPDWLRDIDPDQLQWVDILPIDEAHGDPFPPISLAVRQLEPGKVLAIRHRWEPQPLYDIWSKMGLEWFADRVADEEWHIFVHRPPGAPTFPVKAVVTSELSHLPDEEVVPRLVALAQQLRPGQALDASGVPTSVLDQVQRELGDDYSVEPRDGAVRITGT
jgi:hypothetical protein